jgi:hypothetical protein
MRTAVMRSLTLAAVAGIVAAVGTAGIPAADAGTSITATYPVSGSTYLKAVDATAALGPGTLTSTINLHTDVITSAKLALPAATASFSELGFIPVTATTALIQDGKATGRMNAKTGAVKVTSKVTLQITKLSVAGIPVPVGPSCQTSTPATITVTSERGFGLLTGGTLTGTYTIPRFQRCELATLLINLTVPGPGNTITLTLGAAKV